MSNAHVSRKLQAFNFFTSPYADRNSEEARSSVIQSFLSFLSADQGPVEEGCTEDKASSYCRKLELEAAMKMKRFKYPDNFCDESSELADSRDEVRDNLLSYPDNSCATMSHEEVRRPNDLDIDKHVAYSGDMLPRGFMRDDTYMNTDGRDEHSGIAHSLLKGWERRTQIRAELERYWEAFPRAVEQGVFDERRLKSVVQRHVYKKGPATIEMIALDTNIAPVLVEKYTNELEGRGQISTYEFMNHHWYKGNSWIRRILYFAFS